MTSLAVVFWQMANRAIASKRETEVLNDSDFKQQIESNRVQSAHFYLSPATADVYGSLQSSIQPYTSAVPRDDVSKLMDTLRIGGADVQVDPAATPLGKVEWIGGIILLPAFWICTMGWNIASRRQASTPGQPSRGALG